MRTLRVDQALRHPAPTLRPLRSLRTMALSALHFLMLLGCGALVVSGKIHLSHYSIPQHLQNKLQKLVNLCPLKRIIYRKLKKYLDSDSMIKLYKAYIQPYFDYNDIFNSTSTSYYQSKLIKLQQRCLRNCLPATRKYEKLELHILTGVNSLKDRAESHLLKIMYKRSRLTDYINNDPRPTRAFDGPSLDVPFQIMNCSKRVYSIEAQPSGTILTSLIATKPLSFLTKRN